MLKIVFFVGALLDIPIKERYDQFKRRFSLIKQGRETCSKPILTPQQVVEMKLIETIRNILLLKR